MSFLFPKKKKKKKNYNRLNEYIEIITISAPENAEVVETLGIIYLFFTFCQSIPVDSPPSPSSLLTFFLFGSFSAVSITDIISNIIVQSPPGQILDEVYKVVENLEGLLLCSKTCGEEASVILVWNSYSLFCVCVYMRRLSKYLSHQQKIKK